MGDEGSVAREEGEFDERSFMAPADAFASLRVFRLSKDGLVLRSRGRRRSLGAGERCEEAALFTGVACTVPLPYLLVVRSTLLWTCPPTSNSLLEIDLVSINPRRLPAQPGIRILSTNKMLMET